MPNHIIIKNPVTIPASEEKVYDNGWLVQLVVNAPNPKAPISVGYTLMPYDGKGNVLLGHDVKRVIPNISTIIENHPKLAAAYQAIIEAVTEYEASIA